MPRVKRGTTANKRRKKVLKQAKGFMWRRKTHYRAAKEALLHAGTLTFVGRKLKKRDFRRLWQVRIGAAVRQYDLSYSKFIDLLKKSNIELDRKVLSQLAIENPEVFEEIVKAVKK